MKWSRVSALMSTIRTAKESFGTSTNGDTLIKIVEEWKDDRARQSRPRKSA
jgi:hypothetical protein